MREYRKRIVDKILERKLKGKGAVLIEGPKWCGKTTTAEQISKSLDDFIAEIDADVKSYSREK